MKQLKNKLLVQALSPIALLTIIKNLSFTTHDKNGAALGLVQFITTNLPLLIVLAICVLWIILAIIDYVIFNAFKFTDKKGGFKIQIHRYREEDSLNFFLTLILPVLIDDVSTWNGMALFIVTLILIWALASKTRLFYANPVLSILGYQIAEIKFVQNAEKQEASYIAISREKLTDNATVEYKDITDTVLYVKEQTQ